MTLVKILKRKDGSTVLVAIIIALIISQPLSQSTSYLAGKLSNLKDGQYGYSFPGSGWRGEYMYPIVWALIQLVVLEILAWLYVMAASSMKKK